MQMLSLHHISEIQKYLPKLPHLIPEGDEHLRRQFSLLQAKIKNEIAQNKVKMVSPLNLFLEKVHRAQEKNKNDSPKQNDKLLDEPYQPHPKELVVRALCEQILQTFEEENFQLNGALKPWGKFFNDKELHLLTYLSKQPQHRQGRESESVASKTLLSCFFKEPILEECFDFFKQRNVSEDAVFQALMQIITFMQVSGQELFALRLWKKSVSWLRNVEDAEYILASLKRIWPQLGLQGFEWNSHREDLSTFKTRLMQKKIPRIEFIAIS